MTWTHSLNDVTADEIAAASAPEDAPADQFEVARDAAAAIANSGAAGDSTKRYAVYLTGHANPDHENTPEARDVVAVSVTQLGNDAPLDLRQEAGAYDESQDVDPAG